jgi:hypothetical protein
MHGKCQGSKQSGRPSEASPFAGGCKSRPKAELERGRVSRFDAQGDWASTARPQLGDQPCEEQFFEAAPAMGTIDHILIVAWSEITDDADFYVRDEHSGGIDRE